MFFLGLSILANLLLVVLFKVSSRYHVALLPAVTANYFAASLLGLFFAGNTAPFMEIAGSPWLLHSIFMGFLFISLFYLIGISTRTAGVGITSAANKMSLVIPVLFAGWFFGESMNFSKWFGVGLALAGVFLITLKPEPNSNTNLGKWTKWFPVMIFFGSGMLDSFINYCNKTVLANLPPELFISTAFFTAFLAGIILMFVSRIKAGGIRSVLFGCLLGTVNFFSMKFLIHCLSSGFLPSGEIFLFNNTGVVLLSFLTGVIFFKEKYTLTSLTGVFFCLLALWLIR